MRWRLLKPASHLSARQVLQAPQSVHLPSIHKALHDCVAHGAISSSDSGEQANPPFRGSSATRRCRRLVPPPQVLVQPPHALQSSHRQFAMFRQLFALPMHGLISLIAPSQPASSLKGPSTLRVRFFVPEPHKFEQYDHSAHSENLHTSPPPFEGQRSIWHGSVSTRSTLGTWRPWLPPLRTCRLLKCWPPPQDTEQPCQGVHSEITASCPPPSVQPSISFTGPTHAAPSPVAG
mmetsp:Transcript_113576/g.178693  ORF Transcript_113576/g.178693 Transcript_113576/m.178693 type:complete len:234 (-) Transcript_113576:1009-1710(-)